MVLLPSGQAVAGVIALAVALVLTFLMSTIS
jgi:hypothetical protein